jgi:hypothetical protein
MTMSNICAHDDVTCQALDGMVGYLRLARCPRSIGLR